MAPAARIGVRYEVSYRNIAIRKVHPATEYDGRSVVTYGAYDADRHRLLVGVKPRVLPLLGRRECEHPCVRVAVDNLSDRWMPVVPLTRYGHVLEADLRVVITLHESKQVLRPLGELVERPVEVVCYDVLTVLVTLYGWPSHVSPP